MDLLDAETTQRIHVVIDSRAPMDSCINAAVDQILEANLLSGKYGILVCRLDHGHFGVELSDLVPFGYTEQRDDRS